MKKRSLMTINRKEIFEKSNESGISVLSLVITIIVLLILAAIIFLSSVKTIEEADYSKYASNVSDVSTAFYEKTTAINGDKTAENNQKNIEQVYNYVAKNGKTEDNFLPQNEIPTYTIIKDESQLGIELPSMTVESGTGKRVPVTYATTKGGQIFTWPPYDYEEKYWITPNDTVEHKMVNEITVGNEKFEITLDPIYGTLDRAPGSVDEPDEGEPVVPEEPEVTPPVQEHDFSSKTQTEQYLCSEATCTSPAVYYYKCKDCDEKGTETYTVGGASGHNFGEYVLIREANCTEKGIKQATCQKCGSYSNQELEINSGKHHGSEISEMKNQATCTENGTKVYKCSSCKAELRTENIPATTHNYGEYEITKEANCAQSGIKTKTCTKCNDKITEEIPMDTSKHYGALTPETTKQPTCTEVGTVTYTCSTCGKVVKTEERAKLDHSYGNSEVTKEATCTETGVRTKTCSRCENTETETISIDKDNHIGTEKEEITKEATCAEAGIKIYKCSLCSGEIRTEEIPIDITKHYGTETSIEFETATCTKVGIKIYVCSLCNKTIREEEIPAINHTYGEFVVTKDATCIEKGIKTKKCIRCGDEITEEIPIDKNNHEEGEIEEITKESTCAEAGIKTYKCSGCNEVKRTEEIPVDTTRHHGTEESTIIKEATCTEVGTTKYTCSLCSQTIREEEIEAQGHEYGEFVVTKEATCIEKGIQTKKCIRCQDEITEEILVEKDKHTGTEVEEITKEATCAEVGIKTYKCSLCSGEIRTEEIPVLGHTYKEPAFTWESDFTSAIATFVCTRCYHSEIKAASLKWETIKEATCEEDGEYLWTATVVFETNTYTDTKTQIIKAKGHTYGDPSIKFSNDYSSANAEAECSCGKVHTQDVEVLVEKTKDPTCENPGENKVTVNVTIGDKTYTQTETVVVPPKGHDASWEFKWAEDYSSAIAIFTCSCGEVKTEVAIVNEGISEQPTCTNKGKRTFTATAIFQKENYSEQKNVLIPELGHSYGEPTFNWSADYSTATATASCAHGDNTQTWDLQVSSQVIKEPTCATVGTKEHIVGIRIGEQNYTDKKIEILAPKGHDDMNWNLLNTIEANCVESGEKNYICYGCNECKKEIIPIDKDNHKGPIKSEVTKKSTCMEDGVISNICSACKAVVHTTPIGKESHKYENENVVFEWAEDYSSAIANIKCDNCITETLVEARIFRSVTKNSTCEEYGIMKYTARADLLQYSFYNVKEEQIPMQSHDDIILRENLVKEANCLEKGEIEYICPYCEKTIKTEEIPALGHQYTSQLPTSTYLYSIATCTQRATYYHKCIRCTDKGTTTYEYGPKAAHNWNNENPRECMDCGKIEQETKLVFEQPYNGEIEGIGAFSLVFHEDGSYDTWVDELKFGAVFKAESCIYDGNDIINSGDASILGTVSENGSKLILNSNFGNTVFNLEEVSRREIRREKLYILEKDNEYASFKFKLDNSLELNIDGMNLNISADQVKYDGCRITTQETIIAIYPDGTKIIVGEEIFMLEDVDETKLVFNQPYKGSFGEMTGDVVFHEDGSYDIWVNDLYGEAGPAGSFLYEVNNIINSDDKSIFATISKDGKELIVNYEGNEVSLTLNEVERKGVRKEKLYSFNYDGMYASAIINADGSATLNLNGIIEVAPAEYIKYEGHKILVPGMKAIVYPDGTKVMVDGAILTIEDTVRYDQPYTGSFMGLSGDVVLHEDGSYDLWVHELMYGESYGAETCIYEGNKIINSGDGTVLGTISKDGKEIVVNYQGTEVLLSLNEIERKGVQKEKLYVVDYDGMYASAIINADGSATLNLNGMIEVAPAEYIKYEGHRILVPGMEAIVYPDGTKVMVDGIILTIEETVNFEQPYRGVIDGTSVDIVFHEDGSLDLWAMDTFGTTIPSGILKFDGINIIVSGEEIVVGTIIENGRKVILSIDGSESTFELHEVEKQSIRFDTLYSFVYCEDDQNIIIGVVVHEDGSMTVNSNGMVDTLPSGTITINGRTFSAGSLAQNCPIYPDGTKVMIPEDESTYLVLSIKETALKFNQPYEATLDGTTGEFVFYEDGSATLWVMDTFGEIIPESCVIYTETGIIFGGIDDSGKGTISPDGSKIKGTIDGMELELTLKKVETSGIFYGSTYSFSDGETSISAVVNADGSGRMILNGVEQTFPAGFIEYNKYSLSGDGIEIPIYPDGTKVIVDGAILVTRETIRFEKPYSMSISSGDNGEEVYKVTFIFHENGACDIYLDGVLMADESFAPGTLTYNDADITITNIDNEGNVTTSIFGRISAKGDYIAIDNIEGIINIGPVLESDTTPIHFGATYAYEMEGQLVGYVIFEEDGSVQLKMIENGENFVQNIENAVVYGVNNLIAFTEIIGSVSEDGSKITIVPGILEMKLIGYDNEFPIEWNSIELANSNSNKQELGGNYLYKISELTPPIDVLKDSTLKISFSGEVIEYTVTDYIEEEIGGAFGFDQEENIEWDNCEFAFMVFYEPISEKVGDITINIEKGIYMFMIEEWTTDISLDFTLNANYVETDIPTESDDEKTNAYALVLDNSSDTNNPMPMIFVREDEPILVGDTYKSEVYGIKKVTEVYTDFENTEFYYIGDNDCLCPGWVDLENSENLITSVIFEDRVAPISTATWFGGMTLCKEIELAKLDTSKVKDMSCMFTGCWSLEKLDVGHFNTSQVTNMNNMFTMCAKVKELDVKNFDTSNVIDMNRMFYACFEVLELDVSGFDTSKVTNMAIMFCGCRKITELDVSGFDTSKVVDMNNMFEDCPELTEIDVSRFKTENVTDLSHMFQKCTKLTSLDLSNFDTSNVRDMEYMFETCVNLKTIYVSNKWTTANVTSSAKMFSETENIIGQNNTVYNAKYIDKTYAHIDEGTANPGYLTYKSAQTN